MKKYLLLLLLPLAVGGLGSGQSLAPVLLASGTSSGSVANSAVYD